jgi:hypothetical protein
MNDNTSRYKNIFCHHLDQLIEIWKAPQAKHCDNMGIPGRTANFLAVKLGLTTINGMMPFSHEERNMADLRNATGPFNDKIKQLEEWKQKAQDAKVGPLSFTKTITPEKVHKFCALADEILDIQRANQKMAFGGNLSGQLLLGNKGITLNELAFELGLVDDDWYLAHKLQVTLCEGDYELLGIDPNCYKYPFVITDQITATGYAKEEVLLDYIQRAKILIPDTQESTPIFKHSPDFRTVSALILFKLTEEQAKCIQYLWEQRQKGVLEINGEEMLVQTGIVEKNFKKKLKDVFKRSVAWNNLIIPGSKKGYYRLNIE